MLKAANKNDKRSFAAIMTAMLLFNIFSLCLIVSISNQNQYRNLTYFTEVLDEKYEKSVRELVDSALSLSIAIEAGDPGQTILELLLSHEESLASFKAQSTDEEMAHMSFVSYEVSIKVSLKNLIQEKIRIESNHNDRKLVQKIEVINKELRSTKNVVNLSLLSFLARLDSARFKEWEP